MSVTSGDPHLLWVLRGHGRDVRCLRHRSRGGLELRILWGDELFLTERFSTELTLVKRAEQFRSTLLARGWSSWEPTESPQPEAAPIVSPPARSAETAPSTPPPRSHQPRPTVEEPADRSQHPVVLVVDDEASIRIFMRKYLEAAGYRVRDADEVDSALTVLDEGSVDAVVLDVRMPDRMGWGRTGLEVLAFIRLHAAYASLPVLILTGHPLSPDELGVVRRHRADLFLKPDGYRQLLGRLNELTGLVPPGRA